MELQTLTGAVASVFLYIILGKTVTEIAIALHNRIGQGVKECHRFVCTEIMHYLNDTALLQYKDADVEYVQVWTILDERTCETYGSYCERVYTIDKCPRVPLHANCRCTVLPYEDFEAWRDYLDKGGTMAERYNGAKITWKNEKCKEQSTKNVLGKSVKSSKMKLKLNLQYFATGKERANRYSSNCKSESLKKPLINLQRMKME